MRMTDLTNLQDLNTFMTEPTDGLVEMMTKLEGEVLVLGGSGKMGPELVETLVRADQVAGHAPRVTVASLFPPPRGQEVIDRFHALGVGVLDGDLTDPAFLASLPQARNIIYMVGFKFGSAADPGRAIQMNCVLPAEVGINFPDSRFVIFSSGNPYDYVRPETGGSREDSPLVPHGLYGWSIMGRETAFRATAAGYKNQQVALYRLMYAQHLAYGVVVDLAKMIVQGEPISLAMPYVNLISQRDANDRALRALSVAANPPRPINVNGPAVRVRDLVEKLALHLGQSANIVEDEAEVARIGNDDYCTTTFGPYRDGVDEMIEAAAKWVARGGEDWDLPTMFGNVVSQY
ncbi:MAG TPA: epimerase [Armatimonadota bacterium]|jgi:nucleoside-diphosphate-sugar epimerase